MRVDFKPKNQEEVFAILLFYWAFWWRALLLCVLMLIPILFVILDAFDALLIAMLLMIPITLYLFKKLASRQFKTFSVRWIMPYPESIFERNYLKNVLVYLGVSFLSSFILGEFYVFETILQAFLFYLFAKNKWLPFVIEAKKEDIEDQAIFRE